MILSIGSTATTSLERLVLAGVDAEFEGRASPDAPHLIQPPLDPSYKCMILPRGRILWESHSTEAIERPLLQKGVPRFLKLLADVHLCTCLLQLTTPNPPGTTSTTPGSPAFMSRSGSPPPYIVMSRSSVISARRMRARRAAGG